MKHLAVVNNDFNKDKLFGFSRDNSHYRFQVFKRILKEKGWECHTDDYYKNKKVDLYLYVNIKKRQIPKLISRANTAKVLLIYEPKMLRPLNHNKVIKNLFKLVVGWSEKKDKFLGPGVYFDNSLIQNKCCEKREKKIILMCANKKSQSKNELYSLRKKIIFYFAENQDDFLDLYGYGWDEEISKCNYLEKIYKGRAESKYSVMKNYQFAFCIENEYTNKNYFTEKIFDAMMYGCIPIYKGCLNINKFIPEDLFINYEQFNNIADLKNYLLALTNEDIDEKRNKIIEFLLHLQNKSNIFAEKWGQELATHCINLSKQ